MEQKLCHTFAILAYKESPYLEECIQDVYKRQRRDRREDEKDRTRARPRLMAGRCATA